MARVQLPPKTEELIDEDKYPTLSWISFFDGVATGDTGTIWTPTFVGLTEVGAAVKTGIYFRLTSKLAYFRIKITPATSTTAVAGTTYCDNFPLSITSDGASLTCSSFTAASAGVTASDKRIYTAAWAAIVTPVTITGTIEVN
jgi:hypothetical protein